jgi:hypothetical protein
MTQRVAEAHTADDWPMMWQLNYTYRGVWVQPCTLMV